MRKNSWTIFSSKKLSTKKRQLIALQKIIKVIQGSKLLNFLEYNNVEEIQNFF